MFAPPSIKARATSTSSLLAARPEEAAGPRLDALLERAQLRVEERLAELEALRRRIVGYTIGRMARLVAGAGLIYLAGFAGSSWRLRWYDALLGLVFLPGVMIVSGLAARHRSDKPLRFTGAGGTGANCAVIIALVSNPYTGPGAELFYGATLLAPPLEDSSPRTGC